MYRRNRNWIILLILIPAVAYGAARLAIWYTVKDTLREVSESLSPVATLEYTNILSPIIGPFGAAGIRIKPHIFKDEISVGSALIHIQDPVEKYEFLRAAMRNTIPTTFKLSLNGVSVPLNGDLAASLGQVGASSVGPGAAPAACGTGAAFSLADVKNVGYEDLALNVVMDYAYDRRGEGLDMYLKLEFQDMFELTVEGTIPSSDVAFAVEQIQGVPRVSNLTISMRDLSWSSRFNRYCAGALGITEAAYVRKRMAELRGVFSEAGFEPSPELMQGLEKFSNGAVPLSVSLNPRDPIDITEVSFNEEPAFLMDKLGLEVSIDGSPVRNLGAVKETEPEEQAVQQVKDETYKPTSLDELPQYLQSEVRIFTSDGNVHKGYLNGVDAEKIVLTRELVGGSVTFDVGRTEVEKVLVLRP